MVWAVDGIPTGPGIVKRHGALDVNWDDPRLTGEPGPAGKPGVGVPKGGTSGQVLTKKSNTDHDTYWAPAATGSDFNLDGGKPDSVYTARQVISGGTP